MTATYNAIVRQGADWERVFTLKNPDGTPIDLTGCVGACQVRPKPESTAVVMTPEIVLGGTAGTVAMRIPRAMSSAVNLSALTKGRVIEGRVSANGYLASYDIEIKYTTNRVAREIEGQLCISPQSTRVEATDE